MKASLIKRQSALDLTVGKPLGRILLFMIPLLIGNVFQQLYSMADTVIVGRTLGKAALGGISSTGAISFLITGFASGLTHGFSIVTSQRRGASDDEGMRRSFATGIMLTVVIIGVLTVVAVLVCEPLLRAMNTADAYYPYAVEYISTIFAGMLLSAFYNQFASTLRAIGDSAVPLYFLIIASFINIGLDCLFIIVFGLGVRGAALATLTSQGISAVLTFIYMWVKYPILRFKPRHFKPDLKSLGVHLKLGFPMGLQFSVISLGMIFGQTALNTIPEAVPSYGVASKIDNLACAAINSIGAAASTYVGQNYGARKYDRIRSGMTKLFVFSLCAAVVLGGIVIGLHRPLIMLFIAKDERTEELYAYALKYLLFNSGFYVLLVILVTSRSSLQGMGRGTITLFAAAAEVAMRVGMSLIAEKFGSYTLVCMCNCSAWFGASLILLPGFLVVLNKYTPIIRRGMRRMRMPNPSVVPMMSGKNVRISR